MGFATGFTGGVTVTLGLAYLALAAHERNRQNQADILRAQTRVLNTLSRDPSVSRAIPTADDDTLYPPSRHRSHFVETAKDRWNAEIEGAVRWAQTKDWTSVREDAEERFLGLARAVPVSVPTAEHVREEVKSTGRRAAGVAGQVKEDVVGAVHKSVEKGREMVGRAKAAVYLAEERADARVDAKLLHLSEIERALSQRYEKREDVMKKSVQEVLAERYRPIGERDNTRLRGI